MAVLEHCPSTGRPCGFGSDCGGLGYCKRTGTHRRELGGDAGDVDRLRAENARLGEVLRQVRDYCAGMLAAIDSDPGAADIPGRGELLEDVLRRAGGQ